MCIMLITKPQSINLSDRIQHFWWLWMLMRTVVTRLWRLSQLGRSWSQISGGLPDQDEVPVWGHHQHQQQRAGVHRGCAGGDLHQPHLPTEGSSSVSVSEGLRQVSRWLLVLRRQGSGGVCCGAEQLSVRRQAQQLGGLVRRSDQRLSEEHGGVRLQGEYQTIQGISGK